MANIPAAEVTLNLAGHQGEMWLFSALIPGVRKKELLQDMPTLILIWLFLPQAILDIYISAKHRKKKKQTR